MVRTNIARPTGILRDYIQSFELKMFDTHSDGIRKPLHAFHEILISLIIDSKKPLFEPICTDISSYFCNKPPYAGVMGLQTNMKGFLVFKGRFKVFNIQFKPIGFSCIFQIPALSLKDRFLDGYELFHHELKDLHEQLHEEISFREMVRLTEKFLERKMATNKDLWKNECILKASNSLICEPNTFSIQELAHHSNMTIKTFERKFTVLAGIPPKLYARIRRFNQAIELKLYHEKLNWLDVCVKTGYFDLMHLNRDFKAFAGLPPRAFFEKTPPVFENFVPL
ncbi:MAG TPA: helix-turn-helix domain-containing protein [Lunatimonas sp.]|nr:helix-turn-helix domain-containing protein [Lunatimonas sp.]